MHLDRQLHVAKVRAPYMKLNKTLFGLALLLIAPTFSPAARVRFGCRRRYPAAPSSSSSGRARRCRSRAGLRLGGWILELGGWPLGLGTRSMGVAASRAQSLGGSVARISVAWRALALTIRANDFLSFAATSATFYRPRQYSLAEKAADSSTPDISGDLAAPRQYPRREPA